MKEIKLKDLVPLIGRLIQGGTLTPEEETELAEVKSFTQDPFQFLMTYGCWDGFLPRLVSCCPNLDSLDLDNTDISDLAPLTGLTQLTELSLGNAPVSDLSPLSGLTQLTELYLNDTPVSDLLPLSRLTQLRQLYLRNTQVSDLSPLSGLTQLTELYLRNTPVSDLSPLSGLTQLTELSLNNTPVSDLSPLSGLTQLTELSLDDTPVSDLSPLSGLTQLTRLYLRNTPVSDLSPLSGLTQLTELYLSNTQVSDLSPLSGLTQLTVLSLNDTPVSDLSPLSGLTQLTVLPLDNTPVSDLSPLSGLTQLTVLSLNNTQVFDLSSLEGLRILQFLSLQNLHLKEIPRALVRKRLRLVLDGTEILQQPTALFQLPPEQIRSLYYAQERVPIREGKVIFLGDSGAGKTRTIRRIREGGRDGDYELDSTPGIDISLFPCGDEEGTKIRFWDFGGQEIMQAMHLCFLTERTCYVVVVSNRDAANAMAQARKWLRTVAGFSRQVSVILAVNEFNNVHEEKNIDEKELRALCPALTEVIFYRAKGGDAASFNEHLTRKIIDAVRRLDSVQLRLPKSWAAIREELLNSKKNYISLADYRRICEEHGLGGESEPMENIRMWLLEWLNDMGVCFSYHRDAPLTQPELSNYKVLSPKWLTNGIYRIINNGGTIADGGTLTGKEIHRLLNGRDYLTVDRGLTYKTAEEQNYVLEVMRKFSRSYALPDGREYIPELLPGKRPSALCPIDYKPAATYSLRLRYLPKSLIHRLMIDLRDWNDGAQWRFGVRLRDEETALLIESRDEKGLLLMEVFTRAESEYRRLFHEARLLVNRYIQEMGLVLEEERLSCQKDGFTVEKELYSLIWDYQEDPDGKVSAKSDFKGKRPVKVTIRELLLPLFGGKLLQSAVIVADEEGGDMKPALNAVSAVYPYDTAETLRAVAADENWKNLLEMQESEESLSRLTRLARVAVKDWRFVAWLRKNGKEKEAPKKMNDPNLERKQLEGINEALYRWAKSSPLYARAVGSFDGDTLAKALGPNEEERYQGSYALLTQVWRKHPELGLMPDYKLLSEKEHNRDYYPKYRDHFTHMFKVYLLGLYFYENRAEVKACFPEQDFFPTWTLTALWHDVGYLIETDEGTRDGPGAQEVFNRLTDSLSLPITHLFFDENYSGNETNQQRVHHVYPAQISTLSDCEEKLSAFASFGESVGLSLPPVGNPINEYYTLISRKREGRTYYDHGIISACLLLFVRDALCDYMEESKKFTLNAERRAMRNSFLSQAELLKAQAHKAATAIVLHNITKEHSELLEKEMNQKGVTISDFRIPRSAEPYAWLLRVCDELQCWDRKQFSSQVDKKPILKGGDLSLDGDGVLTLHGTEAQKVEKALRPVVEPFPDFLKTE